MIKMPKFPEDRVEKELFILKLKLGILIFFIFVLSIYRIIWP